MTTDNASGAGMETDEFPPVTRKERAEWILASAKRLLKFCAMENPIELIIEQERHLLLQRLIRFPADADAIAACERIKNSIWRDEQEFLHKHGYYDGLIPPDDFTDPALKP